MQSMQGHDTEPSTSGGQLFSTPPPVRYRLLNSHCKSFRVPVQLGESAEEQSNSLALDGYEPS